MDTVTYPQEKVIDFITDGMVPLRVAADHPLASGYDVTWTPALLVIDSEGKEYHRVVGFLPDDEFVPAILLGIGKAFFNKNEFSKALEKFEEIMTSYPASDSAAEAIFMAGVSGYKNSNDPMPLKKSYEYLAEKHPDSLWTKRAYPYRLLD
jgi:tetratricopeptide (TPR) repeat protein